MTQNDRFDELLRRTVQELDAPPEPPREEMWARIQAERADRAVAGGVIRLRQPSGQPGEQPIRQHRRRSVAQWGAALAAMLVLGIGLGRYSMQQATAPAAEPVASGAAGAGPATGPAAPVPAPYRLAAANHLQRTETLLASLPLEVGRAGLPEVSSWARELMMDTRMLLASPAADDPAMARLLGDLELVLAQIAAIPAAVAEQEIQLIQEGLNQSDVLLRLRAATTPVRRSVGT